MRFLRISLVLLLIISLASCSLFKKVSRSQSSSSEVKSETTVKGNIVVKEKHEKVDTTATTSGDVVKSTSNLSKNPVDTVTTESDKGKVTTIINKGSGRVTQVLEIKPQKVIVKKDVYTKDTEVKSEKTTSNEVSKTSNKEVKVTKLNLGWTKWVVLIIIVVLGYVFRKKIPYIKTLFS